VGIANGKLSKLSIARLPTHYFPCTVDELLSAWECFLEAKKKTKKKWKWRPYKVRWLVSNPKRTEMDLPLPTKAFLQEVALQLPTKAFLQPSPDMVKLFASLDAPPPPPPPHLTLSAHTELISQGQFQK